MGSKEDNFSLVDMMLSACLENIGMEFNLNIFIPYYYNAYSIIKNS